MRYNAGVKKTLIFLCLGIVVFAAILTSNRKQPVISRLSIPVSPTPAQIQKVITQQKSNWLFVPYWSFSNKSILSDDYDRLIYFGIAANNKEIDKEELGYKKLPTFLFLSDKNKERFLAVRMVDSTINSSVLENQQQQEKIISDSIAIAKENGFNGIVLDFEMSSLSFQSVIDKITKFYSLFSKETKKNDLVFAIALYGDTLYRLRPYNVREIEKYADNVLIMSYDFHRARENPGPNFPLNGRDQYGYDFVKMIDDYEKVVPKEKLTIVFGMFGYDWTVNEKRESIKTAQSLSLNQINNKFVSTCKLKDCLVKRDLASVETKVTYKDEEGKSHVVWFEDLESVEKKKEFLRKQGINSVAFWAYSYF